MGFLAHETPVLIEGGTNQREECGLFHKKTLGSKSHPDISGRLTLHYSGFFSGEGVEFG